jgi:hypothetical protein
VKSGEKAEEKRKRTQKQRGRICLGGEWRKMTSDACVTFFLCWLVGVVDG